MSEADRPSLPCKMTALQQWRGYQKGDCATLTTEKELDSAIVHAELGILEVEGYTPKNAPKPAASSPRRRRRKASDSEPASEPTAPPEENK